MGLSPRTLARALLTSGLAVGILLPASAAEKRTAPPVKAHLGYRPPPPLPEWRPKNHINLPPADMAAQMGYGERIDGLLRGRPKETERFYWEDGDAVNLFGGPRPLPPPDDLGDAPPLVDPEEAAALAAAGSEAEAPRDPGELVPIDFGAPRELTDPPDEPPPAYDSGLTPEDIESSVASILNLEQEEGDDPLDAPETRAVNRFLRREGLDERFHIDQSAAGGFMDSEYSSVANGSTTTESRYLEHHITLSKAIDHRSDIVLRNDFLADLLKLRNSTGATWARQVETAGRLGATFNFTRQDSNESEGEIEPDHVLGSFELSGGRDVEDGLSWDVTGYGSSLDYDSSDNFFLDRRLLGAGTTGTYSVGNLELHGLHQVEQDRYPDSMTNDVDRILSQISVTVLPRWDLEFIYTSSYEREGVVVQLDLDSYRAWTTEGIIRKLLGDRLTASLTFGKRSQSVDQVSQFLFDSREYYVWPEFDLQVSSKLAARMSYRDSAVRNRPKRFSGLSFSETIDDREVNDWEVGLEFAGRILDASFLGYFGRTRHVNGETEAFSSFDRRGFAVTVGFRAGRLGRGEFNFSEDHEEYITFPVNDNRARTTGARYIVQF
jgi:hypothetical protein